MVLSALKHRFEQLRHADLQLGKGIARDAAGRLAFYSSDWRAGTRCGLRYDARSRSRLSVALTLSS